MTRITFRPNKKNNSSFKPVSRRRRDVRPRRVSKSFGSSLPPNFSSPYVMVAFVERLFEKHNAKYDPKIDTLGSTKIWMRKEIREDLNSGLVDYLMQGVPEKLHTKIRPYLITPTSLIDIKITDPKVLTSFKKIKQRCEDLFPVVSAIPDKVSKELTSGLARNNARDAFSQFLTPLEMSLQTVV